jgi:hypothetical protein
MKRLLAQIVVGRVLLHVGCILRGGKFRFHLAGVMREIKSIGKKRRQAK